MQNSITFKKSPLLQLCAPFLLAILFASSLFSQSAFITTWNTLNPGVSDSNSITIPVHPDQFADYNYDVDWDNDGIFDEFGLDTAVTHDFGAPGIYTIRIQGDYKNLNFSGADDRQKIIDVVQWGDIQWKTMYGGFKGCTNLNISATDAPDLSNVSNFTNLFFGCTSFNSNIEHWDVSTIEDFYFTFGKCVNFNQPLNNWDVSSATNMQRMFVDCTSFNQPLEQWDVSNVQSFGAMFNNASNFNQPLDQWDVSSCIHFSLMFAGASTFNQPIGNWNTANMLTCKAMFGNAWAFNQDISNWDVSKVSNFDSMFKHARDFNQNINAWDVSNATDMQWMFASAGSFNQPLDQWNVGNVINMNYFFFYANSFNQDIGNWDVSKVTTMANMFKAASNFNQDIGNWDVSQVVMMNSMFEGNTGFDQNLGNWDVSQVASLTRMFNQGALSTANYDSLLIGWNQLDLNDSLSFHAGNAKYCQGWEARANILSTRGWTFDDGGSDNTPPTIICKSINVVLDHTGTVSISPEMLDDGSFGHCTDIQFTASKTTFDCSDIGEVIDTLWVTDALGNESMCVANVAVIDAPFIFNCPADISIQANNLDCTATVFWEELRGNCKVTVTSNHNSGDTFPLGTTTVSYASFDDNQNTNECSFQVTVWTDLESTNDDQQDPSCHDMTNGQVFVSINGGQAPYAYDWDHDETGDFDDLEDQDGLGAGLYHLVVKDDYGCTSTHSVKLLQPDPLNLNTNVIEDNTSSSTTIDLTVNGGTPPYQYDWDYDGTGDFNDPEDITVSESGLYQVNVIDANGCSNMAEVYIEVITSSEELIDHLEFRIFPNPSSGLLTIEFEQDFQEVWIEVLDLRGGHLLRQTSSSRQTQIDLESFAKGTYFLKIITTQGTWLKPFIISGM